MFGLNIGESPSLICGESICWQHLGSLTSSCDISRRARLVHRLSVDLSSSRPDTPLHAARCRLRYRLVHPPAGRGRPAGYRTGYRPCRPGFRSQTLSGERRLPRGGWPLPAFRPPLIRSDGRPRLAVLNRRLAAGHQGNRPRDALPLRAGIAQLAKPAVAKQGGRMAARTVMRKPTGTLARRSLRYSPPWGATGAHADSRFHPRGYGRGPPRRAHPVSLAAMGRLPDCQWRIDNWDAGPSTENEPASASPPSPQPTSHIKPTQKNLSHTSLP